MKLPVIACSAPLFLVKSDALSSEHLSRPSVSVPPSVHRPDLIAARHNGRVRLDNISGINCYESSRRIYHALPNQPLTGRINRVLPKQINWMSRGDDEKLKRASWNTYHDFVMFVCDLEEEDPSAFDALYDMNDRTAEFTLTLGGADRVTLNSEIARECVGLIEDSRMRDVGDHSERFLDVDDHVSVWVKKGTTLEQLEEHFVERTGRLGWALMEAFLQAHCERTGLDAQQLFESEGRVINLFEWRSRYISAALRSLHVYKLAETLVSNNHLGDLDIHQKLYSKIHGALRSGIQAGDLGADLLNMHKFQLDMETSVSNAICYLHRKAEVKAPLTMTTKMLQPLILSELARMPDSELKSDLIKMLNSGWVALKVVAPKQHSNFFLNLRGTENRNHVAGLARGATCYIMSDHWGGLSRGQNHQLSSEELSTCVHEMVHARDWLNDPMAFYENSADPLFLTAMEQRAFHYQNQLQRQQQKAGESVTPRFSHAQHIRSHIRRFYTG